MAVPQVHVEGCRCRECNPPSPPMIPGFLSPLDTQNLLSLEDPPRPRFTPTPQRTPELPHLSPRDGPSPQPHVPWVTPLQQPQVLATPVVSMPANQEMSNILMAQQWQQMPIHDSRFLATPSRFTPATPHSVLLSPISTYQSALSAFQFAKSSQRAMYAKRVNEIMPYVHHPNTGLHPTLAPHSQDSREVYAVTGGWSLPGRMPAGSSLPWPQPRRRDVPIQLAPWIVPNPRDHTRPHVEWDMARLPSSAMRVSSTRRMTLTPLNGELDYPASNPPCNSVTIVCSFPGRVNETFGWEPIIIQRPVVTVWDVFEAIYEYMQTPLDASEMYDVDQLQAAMNVASEERVSVAAATRKRKSAEFSVRHESAGYRRVDCLGRRRYFSGTWIGFTPERGWYLNLGTRVRGI